MMVLSVRMWSLMVATLVLGPVMAEAQTTDSFEYLPGILKAGQTVIVTSEGATRTKGKVVDVSATSLALDGRVFPSDSVTAIERRDSSWNGLLIGLGVGIGAARLSVVRTCDLPDSECAAIVGTVIGLPLIAAGAVIGALIDRAVGNDLVYAAPSHGARTSMTFSPFAGNKRAGLALAMRF
jgi:hypothetical protein